MFAVRLFKKFQSSFSKNNMHLSNKHIAFNSLFNRHYVELCVYCESFVGEKQVAEDLVQDVFVHIWMKRSELNFDETLRSYLY